VSTYRSQSSLYWRGPRLRDVIALLPRFSISEAFARRLALVVDLPTPDIPMRRASRPYILTFPCSAGYFPSIYMPQPEKPPQESRKFTHLVASFSR
jgi:hypothetical protein